MIEYKEEAIQIYYKDMSQLANVIADLNNEGLDLIYNAMEKFWLITNKNHIEKFIIEEQYQGVSELRGLAKKDLLFLMK